MPLGKSSPYFIRLMNVKTSRNSFLILLVTVFIAETMIMAVMHSYLSDISDGVTMILDGLMLTLILAPVIFILLIRPLLNTIGAKEKLEQEILRHREKLEEKILERTEDLRKLTQAVEQSPASVVITDIDANIEYVNPKFIELTGYSLDEVKGQNPRILKSGIQPKSFYEDMWQTLTAGKTWRGEFANRKKNGEIYWENASIAPIKDETGRTTNYVGVKDYIT
ncbi:MAG: PAS domain-containing protein [Fidelibacterota bacterium]